MSKCAPSLHKKITQLCMNDHSIFFLLFMEGVCSIDCDLAPCWLWTTLHICSNKVGLSLSLVPPPTLFSPLSSLSLVLLVLLFSCSSPFFPFPSLILSLFNIGHAAISFSSFLIICLRLWNIIHFDVHLFTSIFQSAFHELGSNERRWFFALMDNGAHATVSALQWYLLSSQMPALGVSVSGPRFMLAAATCGSLIDLDHFAAAGQASLQVCSWSF